MWKNLFGLEYGNCIERFLDLLMSRDNSDAGRSPIFQWALSLITGAIYTECEKATSSGKLRVGPKTIDISFLHSYQLEKNFQWIEDVCPTMVRVIKTATTTDYDS